METTREDEPLSQQIRDTLVVEDMHVREPDDQTIEVGYVSSLDDEWHPVIKLTRHPSGVVALYTRDRDRDQWETGGLPLEVGDLGILSQWLWRAKKSKEQE